MWSTGLLAPRSTCSAKPRPSWPRSSGEPWRSPRSSATTAWQVSGDHTSGPLTAVDITVQQVHTRDAPFSFCRCFLLRWGSGQIAAVFAGVDGLYQKIEIGLIPPPSLLYIQVHCCVVRCTFHVGSDNRGDVRSLVIHVVTDSAAGYGSSWAVAFKPSLELAAVALRDRRGIKIH